MTAIRTYDTTLRDGEQATSISLTLEDKLRIVARLDSFGIDYIEGGFPASNPKDIAFFREARKLPLSHSRIAAFGSTCRKGVSAGEDQGLADLLACGAPVTTIVGKAWDAQVKLVLQASLDENLRMIRDSVSFLAAAGREVVFDAEHFYDGFSDNADYALECVAAALGAGAQTVVLCDTNGGSTPAQVEAATQEVCAFFARRFPEACIGVHCHDDAGCAVANTMMAVGAGARHIQGTINGYGERVGNTDLLTAIANLQLKMGFECVSAEALRTMTPLSRYVAETCNKGLPNHHPYTGFAAFTHKGGLHASAELRMEGAYEHVNPAQVGNTSQMIVSELAGKASLVEKARALGIDLGKFPEMVQPILDEVKARESQGYSYEVADGSLALLVLRQIGAHRPFFDLESFRVIVDDYEDSGALAKDAMSEATIKVHVGESRRVATGEGIGPVGALDNALRLALRELYPQIDGMELVDFKVRILDENVGTDAITRVIITTHDAQGSWGTIGVSENILEASWNALVDSVEYGLIRAQAQPPSHLT